MLAATAALRAGACSHAFGHQTVTCDLRSKCEQSQQSRGARNGCCRTYLLSHLCRCIELIPGETRERFQMAVRNTGSYDRDVCVEVFSARHAAKESVRGRGASLMRRKAWEAAGGQDSRQGRCDPTSAGAVGAPALSRQTMLFCPAMQASTSDCDSSVTR